MKYSIIIPYYRRPTLQVTLASYIHYYKGRDDYEVIIIEDYKNAQHPNERDNLKAIIDKFSDKINIKHLKPNFTSLNPAENFNFGVKNSSGDFLILTNPECVHTSNIINGFNVEFTKNPNVYVICACINGKLEKIVDKFEEFKFKKLMWYHHSKYWNRRLHFCTGLSRNTFNRIGGFDENYSKGIGFEDDDFLMKILSNKVPIVPRDDLLIIHLDHDSSHWKNYQLQRVNVTYYVSKWGDYKSIK